jgi:hypothetical protein
MKKVLFIVVLMISFKSFCQTDTTKINLSVGDELIKFEKQYSTGFAISGLGVGAMIMGTIHESKTLMFTGAACSLIGYFIIGNSHTHIKRAGLLMNEYGVGVKIILK